VTPQLRLVVPEVLEVQVVASDEVRIVPLSPTEIYNGLEVVLVLVLSVVVLVSLLLQEMTVRLKRDIIITCKIFFILNL
jgi:hypothetical protein